MQHLKGSGTSVLYIGRKFLKGFLNIFEYRTAGNLPQNFLSLKTFIKITQTAGWKSGILGKEGALRYHIPSYIMRTRSFFRGGGAKVA
jgi:hypothetical protein